MQLDPTDVAKVAELARLEFSADEMKSFAAQLGKIVTFVEQLSEVNTEGVDVMVHPLGVESKTRPDQLRPGLSREDALMNAPEHDGEFFLVPPVLGSGSN